VAWTDFTDMKLRVYRHICQLWVLSLACFCSKESYCHNSYL